MSDFHEQQLPQELLDIEEQLVDLEPASVCSELHVRLEESMISHVGNDVYMEDYHKTQSHELKALEIHLKDIAPVTMPADMLERMADAMDQWGNAAHEQKIIGFSDRDVKQPEKSGIFGIGFMSAAAAVALLAGVAALVVSDFGPEKATELVAQSAAAAFRPSGHNQDVSEQEGISAPSIGSTNMSPESSISEVLTSKVLRSKEKIIYDDVQNPYRFIEVEYLDEVKVKSPCGRDVILSRPRKDGYVIPIKVY
ncbi:MAG: hypothetical protein ACPIA7_02235 [Akkermansiaceae bacterium]